MVMAFIQLATSGMEVRHLVKSTERHLREPNFKMSLGFMLILKREDYFSVRMERYSRLLSLDASCRVALFMLHVAA